MAEEYPYNGQFVDGPDAGNFVSAKVPRVHVKSTLTLNLDDDGKLYTSEVTGYYVWQDGWFRWEIETSVSI